MQLCAPYRGALHSSRGKDWHLGVQCLNDDASLFETPGITLAFHGYLRNWDELEAAFPLDAQNRHRQAERLFHLWMEWGEGLFAKLNGEFVLAIADADNKRLLVLNSISGTRALFWGFRKDGSICLAAEIRQLRAAGCLVGQLDPSAVATHLSHLGSLFEPEKTLYRSVRRCVPGRVYSFPLDAPTGGPELLGYQWRAPRDKPYLNADRETHARMLRGGIKTAVAGSLSAARTGLSLSGGIDSPVLWSVLHELAGEGNSRAAAVRAFSLVFPGRQNDESTNIQAIHEYLGSHGRCVDATGSLPSDVFERLIENNDGLAAAGSVNQLNLALRILAEDGCSAYMNGLAADAWFLPPQTQWLDLWRTGRKLESLARMYRFTGTNCLHGLRVFPARFFHNIVAPPGSRLRAWRKSGGLPDWLHADRHRKHCEVEDWINGLREEHGYARAELLLYLALVESGNAMEVLEQTSAQYGLEMIVPYMDQRLIDLAFRIRPELLAGDMPKGLLREAYRGRLPDAVLDDCRKVLQDVAIESDQEALKRLKQTTEWWLVDECVVDGSWLSHARTRAIEDRRVSNFMHRLLMAEYLGRQWG